MKEHIRLLVENLFNDIYDIDNENNLTIEIADELYNYKMGDIYYLNKNPYAICCGESFMFSDNRTRFLLLEKPGINKFAKVPSYLEILGKKNENDENGYENTQIIKNEYYLKSFPAFEYCCNFNDNAYLPSIYELKILYNNMDLLNKKLIYIPNCKMFLINYSNTISSSQKNASDCFIITKQSEDKDIGFQDKMTWGLIYPFIKI